MKTFEEFLTEGKRSGSKEAEKIVKRVFGRDADKMEVYVDLSMDEFVVRSVDPEEYNPREAEMRNLADLLKRELSGKPNVQVHTGIKFDDDIKSTIITVEY